MKRLLPSLGLLLFISPCWAGITHSQGSQNSSTTASIIVTLTNNPALGDLVCVGIGTDSTTQTLTSVKDSNLNAYTVTTNSPSTFQSGAGKVWLAYLLSAPANATKTITVTLSIGANTVAWVGDFTVSGGIVAFDKDAKANTATAGTTINTPSITPAASGELLWATAAAGGTISAPAAGGTLGVWTGSQGGIVFGDQSEYDLSASSATAVQFTQSSGGWSAMAMAFTFTAGGAASSGFNKKQKIEQMERGLLKERL